MSKKFKRTLYTDYPYYQYGLGDTLKLAFKGGGGAGAIGSAIGGVAGNLISNGYQSTAGDILNVVGDIGSMIPGPWGAIIGGGAKLLSGATNALFGEKVNESELNQANANINALSSFQSNADTFEEIQLPQTVGQIGEVYQGGLFNTSAEEKNQALRSKLSLALQQANRSIDNNVQNIKSNQMDQLQSLWYKNGGNMSGIYIKPNNKGKFTASAKRAGMGVLEYASHILANKEDYSPLMRKRANFAKNATKFKHDFGGNLLTNGAVFSNGTTWIGNGYHHSENPYEGVPMGVAPDGKLNLVELNEFIWRDAPDGEYVFAGDSDGTNKMKVPQYILDKYHLDKDITFAEAAKKFSKESEERPNDPIAKAGMTALLTELMQAQEEVRMNNQAKKVKKNLKSQLNNMSDEEVLALLQLMPGNNVSDVESQEYAEGGYPTWMRYAPIVGSTIGAITALFDKPDYSSADFVKRASKVTPRLISSTPLGNYITYNPLDKNYYVNQLRSGAAAGRRSIMNLAGGNTAAAMANILASDYNILGKLGELNRLAEEYNQALKERVATFNRATDLFNAESAYRAAAANLLAQLDAARLSLTGALYTAQLRDAERARIAQSRSTNFTNLFDNLGALGEENFAYNQVEDNKTIRFKPKGKSGGSFYEGPIFDKDGNELTFALGGMLTKKSTKKRR